MIKKYLPYLFLFIILIFAVFLRLYKLDKVPAGFNFDEAMVGYNAYTLSRWGMDQSGNKSPLLYIQSSVTLHQSPFFYLTAVSEKILGVNKFALRFTPVFFGVLTIGLVFFLVKKIFIKERTAADWIALSSAFLLTISTWHIYISRSGYELTIAQFFFLLGLYVFLSGKEKLLSIIFTVILFFAAALTYRSYLIFLPLFLPLLSVIFRREFKRSSVRIIFPLLILFFITVCTLIIIHDPRRSDTLVFANLSSLSTFSQMVINIIRNYVVHFSLLLNFAPTAFGPNYWMVNRGLFYLFELPLFMLGLIFLAKTKHYSLKLFLVWLFLYPLPNSFTTFGNANRMSIILPLPQIIGGLGLWWVLKSLSKKLWLIIFIVIIFSLSHFWVDYFSYYPRKYGNFNHEGPEYVYNYVKTVENKYERIFVHNFNPVFFLFFSKYDFPTYQQDKKLFSQLGKTKIEAKLGKALFVDNIFNITPQPHDLFIDQKEDFPSHVSPLQIIYLQNGSEFAWVVPGEELINLK